MKLFQEGDKSKAVCEHCERIVGTTFLRRDVPFSAMPGMVAKGILVAACDECQATVSIPAQSTPAISKVRREKAESVEARLPAIYLDVLDYAVHTIDKASSTDFRRVLLTYFLYKAVHSAQATAKLKALHKQALAAFPEHRGTLRRRLSMKVAPAINEGFKTLALGASLSTTDVLKSIVFEIKTAVLERPSPQLMAELRTLSALSV